jgi:DNA-binding CsgD family transcriptional regulator
METVAASCPVHLSKREKDICRLVLIPLPYKQIADRLGITENTVKTHNKHIHAVTHTRGKDELIVWLIKHPECLPGEPVPQHAGE